MNIENPENIKQVIAALVIVLIGYSLIIISALVFLGESVQSSFATAFLGFLALGTLMVMAFGMMISGIILAAQYLRAKRWTAKKSGVIISIVLGSLPIVAFIVRILYIIISG